MMGYYLIEPHDDEPPAGTRLIQWIKQHYPDMTAPELIMHMTNLVEVMDMSIEQLEQTLLDDEPLDPDMWDSLDEPPY